MCMVNNFLHAMFFYYDAWKNGFTSYLKHKKDFDFNKRRSYGEKNGILCYD